MEFRIQNSEDKIVSSIEYIVNPHLNPPPARGRKIRGKQARLPH